jgi:hypothetical protein
MLINTLFHNFLSKMSTKKNNFLKLQTFKCSQICIFIRVDKYTFCSGWEIGIVIHILLLRARALNLLLKT